MLIILSAECSGFMYNYLPPNAYHKRTWKLHHISRGRSLPSVLAATTTVLYNQIHVYQQPHTDHRSAPSLLPSGYHREIALQPHPRVATIKHERRSSSSSLRRSCPADSERKGVFPLPTTPPSHHLRQEMIGGRFCAAASLRQLLPSFVPAITTKVLHSHIHE